MIYSEPLSLAIAFAAGAVASALNSVAGGGSLISFPVLTVGLGIPSLQANATNSVGLWPGSLSSAFGFHAHRGELAKWLRLLLLPTAVGSVFGAILLGATTQRTFDLLVPALIFLATILLALQPKVKEMAAKRETPPHPYLAVLLQFLVSIYGGYFGAGMGIMMLGALAVSMHGTIHEMNAVKNWLAVFINIAAMVVFLWQGLVLFEPAVALALGGIVGGYIGAKVSQRFDSEPLRKAIVGYGFLMAAFFAWRAL